MDLLIAPNTVTAPNADAAPVAGTPGWATNGNPSTGTPATTLAAYEFNALMAEVTNAISAAGLIPSRFDNTQLSKAIALLGLPPIGSVTQIATSKWSPQTMPQFVPCDGLTTRTQNVDPQLQAQFQATAFLPEYLPILGTAQPFVASSIAFNGSYFCAVGNGYGLALTGSDGIVWKPNTFAQAPWVKVIWVATQSQFVALSSDGHIGTSPDGKTWAVSQPLSSAAQWSSIRWTGSLFCAIGLGVSATSADLLTWQLGSIGMNAYDVAWNGSLFVAVGAVGTAGSVATSTDGLIWAVTQSPTLQFAATRITHNGATFCAAGLYVSGSFASAYSYTSTNGTSWTQGTLSTYAVNISDLIFDGTNFVAVSSTPYSSSTAISAKSTDGLNWTVSTSSQMLSAVAAGNGVYVGVGNNKYRDSTGPYYAIMSTDALTWVINPLPGAGAQGAWTCSANNGSRYVALNAGTNQVATSTDGRAWTLGTLPVSANWSAITWNGSVFCAIASGSSAVITSPDGLTWALGALPSVATWTAIAWNGTVFAAVASGGTTAAYSSNGLAWSSATLPSSGAWSGIAAVGSTFCAIASGGTAAATSTTGATWAVSTLPATANWSAIASNGTTLLAVASGGTAAATSTNGTAWTQRTLPASSTWSDVAWNGSVFCAVATGTSIAATSPDGVTWTQITTPSPANWSSLAGATGTFLLTSNNSNGVAGLLSASGVFLAPLVASNDSRFINIMRVI